MGWGGVVMGCAGWGGDGMGWGGVVMECVG